MPYDTADLVRLDTYPIHELQSQTGQALVARCRQLLQETACCSLPCFVSEAALAKLIEESREVAKSAYYSECRTNVYFSEDDPNLPANHPQRIFLNRTSAFVPADAIPADTAMRALYKSPYLMPFVRACLNEQDLYEYDDPLADVIVNVVDPGQEFPWHFDTNEFSISLMTQTAEKGGLFEFVSNLRSGDDENYRGVTAVLQGDRSQVRTLDLKPGDLQIFKGRHTLHRVTKVEGNRPRYIAIFSYAKQPGMVGRVERMRQLYGKVLPVHIEAEKAINRADSLTD